MQKKVLRYFLIAFVSIGLAFSSMPQVFAKNTPKDKKIIQKQMELIQNDIKVDDLDIEPINTKDLKKNVVPNAKQEGKKIFFLFLKTMFLVALVSGIIYTILLFIKKYKASDFIEPEFDEYAALDLSTPTTKQEAFMSFLSRSAI